MLDSNWRDFLESAGGLGVLATERLLGPEIGLLGTIRTDGSPRISPCEIYAVDGELLLGMMWQSRKAKDLLRDPRITVHSIVTSKDGGEGDVKLSGRVHDVTDPGLRERYADTVEAAIDWRPSDPYHLFAVDIESAGFIRFGEHKRAVRWTPVGGLEELRHPDA